MPEKEKTSGNKKLRAVILVLLLLVLGTGGAFAWRMAALRQAADQGTTVVVPDNLVGEEDRDGTAEPTGPEGSAAPEKPAEKPASPGVSQSGKKEAATIALYAGQNTDNAPFLAEHMLPGDRVKRYFAVRIYHDGPVTVKFTAPVTGEVNRLSQALQLRLTELETGAVVCQGSFAALDAAGYEETVAATAGGETLRYYEAEVWLPTETGNEFQNAALMADFIWSVADDVPLNPPTGDTMQLWLWVCLAAAAAAGIALLLGRKEGRRDRT